MHFAILLLVSLALSSSRTSTARVDSPPPNARQTYDRLPSLEDALNVAKSPYEPVTLAAILPANVARTDEEPMATTLRLMPDGDSSRTTRSAVSQPDGERVEQPGSSSTTSNPMEEMTSSTEEAATTQTAVSEESPNKTDAPQAEASTAEAETERVGKDDLSATTTTSSTTAAPESASSESGSSSTQEPIETTTETESASSSTEETPSSSSVAPKELEEVATTKEPEPSTTTAAPETTTTAATTTPAPETTPESPPTTTATETPTSTSSEATTTTTAEPSESGENDQPKEQPAAEFTTTTTTTSAPDVSSTNSQVPSTEPPTEAPSSGSPADVERDQQQPTTTTTSTTTTTPAPETTTETQPGSSQSSTSSTEKPKLEEPRAKDEDKPSCNHLPTYDSDEIQKVFREETTYRNGTIKGKFTYINFDQRYRLVHYTRLPYGPVKIDRVEELGKPGSSVGDGSRPSSSSAGDVLQLRNLLPNSLFGFPFLNPHAGGRPQASFGNRNDDSNAYFYSTDSLSPLASPNPLDSRSSQSPRSRTDDIAGLAPAAATTHHHEHHKLLDVGTPRQPVQETAHSRQLNRLEGAELSPFTSAGRTGHQFKYSNPFQSQGLMGQSETSSDGFALPYFTTPQPDHQTASHFQPWTPSSIYPAYLRINHQLSDNYERGGLSHSHHQPHGHEHYVAPFMFARTAAEESQSPAAVASGDRDRDSSRVRLQVKSSKSLNFNGDQTKSAQLRMQPSIGHYSHLISPSQVYQRNQQSSRLGKQSQQRHRSLASPANQVPVVYHVLTSPYNRHQFHQGAVTAYDQDN